MTAGFTFSFPVQAAEVPADAEGEVVEAEEEDDDWYEFPQRPVFHTAPAEEFRPPSRMQVPDGPFDSVEVLPGLVLRKGRISGPEASVLLRDDRVSDADLVPDIYEGGFKLWEGALDLCQYLVQRYKLNGKRVLELGCGHGLPGILMLMAGADVHFQDFNKEVLQHLTLPNVAANFAALPEGRCQGATRFFSGDWSAVGELLTSQASPQQASADGSVKAALSAIICHLRMNAALNQGTAMSSVSSCCWACVAAGHAAQGLGGNYDIILTSESVYCVEAQQRLVECIKQVLQPPHGVVLVAAKTYYFGVGGGTKTFRQAVKHDGIFEVAQVQPLPHLASPLVLCTSQDVSHLIARPTPPPATSSPSSHLPNLQLNRQPLTRAAALLSSSSSLRLKQQGSFRLRPTTLAPITAAGVQPAPPGPAGTAAPTGLSILTRPATNPLTSPAVEQQPIMDDERTLVNETRRFFESSLLVMWLEFDDEQKNLEEQWRQNQHQHGGQLQQPPNMRVSLSTFVRLRPPWVARLTASQRQVCVCKTCCNLDNLLTALAQHKKSLQLPPAAAIAAPLATPLAAAGPAPQPPPLQGGAAPPVAEEEVEFLTAAASPFIDPIGEFEQQAHRWQAEQERQPWLAPPPFSPHPSPTLPHPSTPADQHPFSTLPPFSPHLPPPFPTLLPFHPSPTLLPSSLPSWPSACSPCTSKCGVIGGALELSTQEVELCSAPQRDAHAFASSIPGSMSMHNCFFPAAGIEVEWSQTACACAQCMTPAPRGVCMRPSITKPFVTMPMFDQKRDDKHWDDECLTLLCSFAPDSVMQLCTLGKKLSVKMLNEYCKAVGLCVPANTLRADLRYMVLQHINEQAECD
ncbi:hypothetical protein QJQ45_024313 [Haematococcus lacustris]|nr:hypothetical protein QJQ45_024313 [Haematococcus lacustris]